MYFQRRHKVLLSFLLLCSTQVVYGDFMMKAIMHGAAMGMMMRPRILPIPIPVNSNLLSGFGDMLSGFRRQFDAPQVVVLRQNRPQPKFVIIQDNNQCCGSW